MSSWSEPSASSDLKATSYILRDKASIEWKIQNFSLCCATGNERISSPLFQTLDSTWRLTMFPNYDKEDEGSVGIYVVKVRDIKEKKNAFCTISIINKYNEKICERKFKQAFNEKDLEWGFKALVSRKDLLVNKKNELLPGDVLTVLAEVYVLSNIVHGTKINNDDCEKYFKTQCNISCFNKLSREFGALYEQGKDCDVRLLAESKEFHAHKLVIAARSPVFRAMFDHDMDEKRTNVVSIPDMSASALNDLLVYIYSGEVKGMTMDKAIQMFAAADKYDLQELKTECANFISVNNLSLETFFQVAEMADKHDDARLNDAIRKYMQFHSAAVFETTAWDDLFVRRPSLVARLLKPNPSSSTKKET